MSELRPSTPRPAAVAGLRGGSGAGRLLGRRLGWPLLAPIACALAALTTAGLGVVVSLRAEQWDTPSLVRIHYTLPIAQLAVRDDPSFRLRQDSGYYDGAFFYAIARDPLAIGEAHHLLREAPYYWGHPGYGWLAWLASGAGRPGAVPDALLAVGLLSMLVAGAAASVLARLVGWTPWGGLVVALNPGLVFAVNSDTSEPLGAALLLAALAAYARGARRLAVVLLAALCLVKEPVVLVPPPPERGNLRPHPEFPRRVCNRRKDRGESAYPWSDPAPQRPRTDARSPETAKD